MPIIIEGKEVFGFADHDFEKLKEFTTQGRINWFKYRFDKILLNPIEAVEKIVKEEGANGRLENEHTSIFTIVMLAICVGIDLLGGFFSGKEGDTTETEFKLFVDEYFDRGKEYSKNPYINMTDYSTLLYKLFRCGLAHNLTIKKVGFSYGEVYFRKEGANYYISVNKLYEDLKQSFGNYIADIKDDKNGLQVKFNLRFQYVFLKRA